MKLRNSFIFLFIMGIVDTYISYVFAVDFTFQTLSFVPHVALMALLLVTYDRTWLDRVLIGALFGLIYDFFFQSTFPISFLFFPLLCYLVGYVYQKKEDLFWLAGTCMLSGFLYDFLPYLFYRVRGIVQLRFMVWLSHLEIETMIFQFITLLALYFGFNLLQQFFAYRSKQQRKERHKMLHKHH